MENKYMSLVSGHKLIVTLTLGEIVALITAVKMGSEITTDKMSDDMIIELTTGIRKLGIAAVERTNELNSGATQ